MNKLPIPAPLPARPPSRPQVCAMEWRRLRSVLLRRHRTGREEGSGSAIGAKGSLVVLEMQHGRRQPSDDTKSGTNYPEPACQIDQERDPCDDRCRGEHDGELRCR